jgi:hypothetical protein
MLSRVSAVSCPIDPPVVAAFITAQLNWASFVGVPLAERHSRSMSRFRQKMFLLTAVLQEGHTSVLKSRTSHARTMGFLENYPLAVSITYYTSIRI